ncbi:MAG: zinc ribbon domain-containing protein [Anaerolineae bacterium]|nr:zinc ribbon domain-containing protein [Anaerolineae bacterium]
MSIGSILLGLSLLILVVLILAQPFWAQSEREPRPRSRKQQLLMQKEAVLEEIRALDFEYDTGKIPEEAYQAQRTELMAVATATLKALDELGTEAPADDVAAQIEAAINRVRSQKQSPAQAVTAVSTTATVAKTAVPVNGASKFCTECGAKVDASDKFCAACGNKIAVPA